MNIPRLSSRRTESGDAVYTTYVRSRPLPTSHILLLHTSAIRLHTSSFLQLFILHQSYGHTFPISQKTSEPKVHEVSRYSRVFRMIELSHFSLLLFLVSLALDGFPIVFLFLFSLSLCHSDHLQPPFPAVFRRALASIHTDSSFYTVLSIPEVF